MRKWTWVLAGYVCLSIAPVAGAVDEPGARAGGIGRGGAGQAAAQARATSRLNASEGRPVGANFGADRAAGASAAAGSTGRDGVAGVKSRRELRGAAGKLTSQGQSVRGEGAGRAESLPRAEKGRPAVHPQQTRLIQQAETNLTRRLAGIDRMRDQALENGDSAMLAKADQLEQLARLQHEQRIAQVSAFETGQPSAERSPMGERVRNIFAPERSETQPQPETLPEPPPVVETAPITELPASIADDSGVTVTP